MWFIVYVDCKERKFRKRCGGFNDFLAPVKFVVSQSHGGKAHFVHPIRDKLALGEVGRSTALPHIARGKENGVIVAHSRLDQIGGKAVYTFGVGGVDKLAVKIVDIIKIKGGDNANTAIVALFVTVCVYVAFIVDRGLCARRSRRGAR